jgi:hypothetical protein
MGQLLTLKEMKVGLGLDWYDVDVDFKGNVELPSTTYPHVLYIRSDKLTPKEKIEIRKFVKDSCDDVVIHDVKRINYSTYYYMPKGSHRWDWDTREVNWDHEQFYFQDESEMMLFKLKFSELIVNLTPYDPERPPKHIQEAEHRKKEAEAALAKAQSELTSAKKKLESLNTKSNSFDDDEDDGEDYSELVDEEWDEYDECCIADDEELDEVGNRPKDEDREISDVDETTLEHLIKQAYRWREGDPIFFVDEDGNQFKHKKLERLIRAHVEQRQAEVDLKQMLDHPFGRNRNPW